MAPKRKRSQSPSFSNNPNTTRERRRLEARDPERVTYENMKKADMQALARLKTKLFAQTEYQAADEAKRATMLQVLQEDLTNKRYTTHRELCRL